MSISMSEATLEHGTRDSLLASSVEAAGTLTASTTVGGGSATPGIAGASLAGITPEFVSAVPSAIDSYANEVLTALNQLEAVSSSAAFQGAAITTALQNFITGVKEVANSYVTGLQEAEKQIMNSVHTVYNQQDSDLSGDMGSDTSALESQKVSAGS